MIRLTTSALVSFLFPCSVFVTFAEDETPLNWEPTAFPEERYEKAWERNPFNLSTRPDEAATGEPFAKDLALASISVIGENQRVLLVNRKTKKYESVSKGRESETGITLISVTAHKDRSQVVAVISKGGKEATVKFDSALTAAVAKDREARRNAEAEANARSEQDVRSRMDRGGLNRARPGSRVRTPADVENMRRLGNPNSDLENENIPPSVREELLNAPAENSDLENRRLLRQVPRGPQRTPP